MQHKTSWALILTTTALLAGWLTFFNSRQAKPITTAWVWELPPTFPTPFVPDDNPITYAKVELGRHLFYDTRLSVNGKISCATCHIQALAFTDGKATAVGTTGELHPRNSQSLVNLVFSPTLNWANPAVTRLETQLLTPLFGEHPIEMGLTDDEFKKVQHAFANDKRYQKLFENAYNKPYRLPDDFRLDDIAKAIASFERSITSTNSKYDQYLAGQATLTASEKRGMDLFFGEKAECSHCHGSINFNDQMIYTKNSKTQVTDINFHNTGLYNLSDKGDYPEQNQGLFEVTGEAGSQGKFKAPSLRNVAVTAPYNHDGSSKTLQAVLQNYANGGRMITDGKYQGDGRHNVNKSDLIVNIDLSESEQADIIEFLNTLTDETLLTNPAYANPFQ